MKFDLNKEKIEILKSKGNILVTANPGTGKTLLLANKFLELILNGLKTDQILCLTFTEKAKREMEQRIINLLSEHNFKTNLSKLNIYTFHSYAYDNIERGNIISSNLLRFTIYKFLIDNEIFNYGDQYLINDIVPKLENLIRYLKSFGITPDQIDIEQTKALLQANDKISEEELHQYTDHFIEIFSEYERVKFGKGPDYADLLIEFLNQNKSPKYEVVLIDELQDVNKIEADIALSSAKQFFAVGDKKQAIFGFQGGSILNFEMFGDSSHYILSENYRSTDEILNYAREYFVSNTSDQSHLEELKDLRNVKGKTGEKPVIYEIEKNSIPTSVVRLVQQLQDCNGNIAIIARTNSQIMQIAKELSNNGIEYSTTFFSSSSEAKKNIISCLKGVLSNFIDDVKNSMFTPYFPISLQEAFQISEYKDLTLESFYEKCPEFFNLRNAIQNVEDVNKLFKEVIIPISISYGKDYFVAALNMQKAYQEAIEILDDKTINNLSAYLNTADLLADEIEMDSKVILTTVHKAKGKQFDNVIYVPTKLPNKANYQDQVVEAILETKGIKVLEELEEETLRINFVAFTRAMERLYIIADKSSEFLNDHIDQSSLDVEESYNFDFEEAQKKAFSLFVSGEFNKAKELLDNKEVWLTEYIKNHFESLDHISFSSLNHKPFDYLTRRILKLSEFSSALNLGSDAHSVAEKIVKNEEYEIEEELIPYEQNIKEVTQIVHKDYPELLDAEYKINIPLSDIIDTDESINFLGFIDAIFKNNDDYLLVDWKTSIGTNSGSDYRRQLEIYKRAFAVSQGIDLENIKIAIAYIGLRNRINTGDINFDLDIRQPQKKVFDTVTQHINKLLEWKKNPDQFLKELSEQETDEVLWRSIVEQYKNEASN